jgi:integrase
MATIEKRIAQDGSISYRVKIRLKGMAVQTATFTRLTDARKWEQETEVSIRDGKYFKTIEAKKHSLADLIERYKNEVLPLKPKSLHIQIVHLNWWQEKLGNYLLSDITSALISEFRQKLLAETIRTITEIIDGKKVTTSIKRTPSTANRYMAALSHVFTIAVKEWEWIDDTPLRKITKLKEPRGIVRFLSDDERKHLLAKSLESNNPFLHTIVTLALSTGARKMEILSLRWKDIDFKRKIITLHETKNGERRILPLVNYGFELLNAHATKHQPYKGDDFVFPNKFGTAPIEIKKCWNTALKKAGIDEFRFHDLRHSAASYLAMNGASLAEIAEVLGHKTLSMVKRYAHLSDAHTATVVNRMNEAIFAA